MLVVDASHIAERFEQREAGSLLQEGSFSRLGCGCHAAQVPPEMTQPASNQLFEPMPKHA